MPKEGKTPPKKKEEMLEVPFLGRIVDAIVKKFKGLKDLSARR